MVRITKVLLLVVCALASIQSTFAAPASPFRTVVRGEVIKIGPAEIGNTLSLTFRTPRGIHDALLRRVSSNVQKADERYPSAVLFRGILRRGALGANQVAGDLINGKFRLTFIDRRGRVVQFSLPLSSSSGTADLTLVSQTNKVLCASEAPQKIAQAAVGSAASSGGKISLPATSTSRRLLLNTYADYEMFQRFGDSTNAEIQATLNAAQTVYAAQLGMGILIGTQRIATTPGAPFQSTEILALLEGFRTYVNDELRDLSANSNHLFTGKDIAGYSVGIAYVGQVCQNRGEFSFGLSQYVGSATSWIVTAHEIGHTLDAQHTAMGDGIMSPVVDSSLTRFSSSSLTQIQSYIDASGSCLAFSGPDVDLTLKIDRSSRFTARITPQGDLSGACSVDLYGLNTRPTSIAELSQGKLLKRSVVAGGVPVSWRAKVPHSSGRLRRTYFGAIINCARAEGGMATGSSAISWVRSSYSKMLSRLERSLK